MVEYSGEAIRRIATYSTTLSKIQTTTYFQTTYTNMPEQRQQLQGRGRGRSSGGRGQRGAGRRGHSQNQGRGQVNKKKLILPDDAEKELGDNIYIINHSGQADKYVKTTEAILNYIQKTYKNGEDLKKALKREQDLDFTVLEPTAPGTIDTTTPAGFK